MSQKQATGLSMLRMVGRLTQLPSCAGPRAECATCDYLLWIIKRDGFRAVALDGLEEMGASRTLLLFALMYGGAAPST